MFSLIPNIQKVLKTSWQQSMGHHYPCYYPSFPILDDQSRRSDFTSPSWSPVLTQALPGPASPFHNTHHNVNAAISRVLLQIIT